MKTYLFIILSSAVHLFAGPFAEWAVTQNATSQAPDLDEFGGLVWQQWYEEGSSGDWDIYWADMTTLEPALLVANWTGNQTHPAVYNQWVVFEDEFAANDHDIYIRDISDDSEPSPLAATELDESSPAVHGNTAVWQELSLDGGLEDWDIAAADFTKLDDPQVYSVTPYTANQQRPGIYRDRVVWQDDYYGDQDISSTDIWLRNFPVEHLVSASYQDQERAAVWKHTVVWHEDFGGGDFDILAADISDPQQPKVFFVTDHPAAQMNPDIHEHLVVWQDNRNGNWDIYGYNLITRKEFQITRHSSDQTNPTIGGGFAAWEDFRTGLSSIYAAVLDGNAAAACPVFPAGDLNGDCRQDLEDLLILSQNWMACGLEPVSACTE